MVNDVEINLTVELNGDPRRLALPPVVVEVEARNGEPSELFGADAERDADEPDTVGVTAGYPPRAGFR